MSILAASVVAAESPESPPTVTPHVLLVAATKLCAKRRSQGPEGDDKELAASCDRVIPLALNEPGLTATDRAGLHLLLAMRAGDDHDEPGMKQEITTALQADIDVQPPETASPQFARHLARSRSALLQARARGEGPRAPAPDAKGKARRDQEAAAGRERPAVSLFHAVRNLYGVQPAGVELMLGMAGSLTNLRPEEEVELLMWQGLACWGRKECSSSSYFKDALRLDPNAQLPDVASKRIQQTFEGLRPPQNDDTAVLPPRREPNWAMISGGAGVLIGGALALGGYARGCPGGDCRMANAGIGTGWSLGVAGALALGGGLTWMILSGHPAPPVRVGPGVGGAAVSVSGSF